MTDTIPQPAALEVASIPVAFPGFSPEQDKLLPALMAVQAAIRPIKPNREATVSDRGPKRKYAALDAVIDMIREPMHKAGLVLTHYTQPVLGGPEARNMVSVVTELWHVSGQWRRTVLDIPVNKWDAQGFGSALTYAKRYNGGMLIGYVTENDDDDGTGATKGLQDAAANPGEGAEEEVPHPTLQAAKTVQDLVKAMNALSPRQKSANREWFNAQRKALPAAAAE